MCPILRSVEQEVLPQGQIGVQASPEDFGAAIGRGVQAIGQGLEDITESQRIVDEQKGKVWAIKAASDARLQWAETFQQMQTDPEFQDKYGEDGSGFTEAFKTNFEDYANEAIASAPTPQAKVFVEGSLRQIGESMLQDSATFQATVGSNWALNTLATSHDNNGRAVFMNPEKYDEIQKASDDAVDNMPYLNQDQREAEKEKSKQNLAFAAGKGWAQKSPEAVLATLSPDDLKQFKPTARVVKALNSDLAVVVPRNITAPLVKPFAADKIIDVIEKTNTESDNDAWFIQAGEMHAVDPKDLKMRASTSDDSQNVMQLAPHLAAELGVTDITNPQQNIFAAAKHIAQLQTQTGGDQTEVDKMYYGGNNKANWGPNTDQYAENLRATRSTISGGTEAPPSSGEEVITSVMEDKPSVQTKEAPQWFNDLPWEQQYAIVETAKQGVSANQTRDAHIAASAEKQKKLEERQAMSEGIDGLIDGSLTVTKIRNDPRLGYEGKTGLLRAIQSDLAGKNKTNPQVFSDLFARIHSTGADRITNENQLVSYVGNGIDYEDLGKLRKEMQGGQTSAGKTTQQLKKAFLASAKNRLVKTSMFSAVDPTQAENFYQFQQSFLTQYDAKVEAGKDPNELLNPSSPDYMGNMIAQFDRSPQQVMRDMAEARRKTMSNTANTTSKTTTPSEHVIGEIVTKKGVSYRYKGGAYNNPKSWEVVK